MPIRILPPEVASQIAAGEVVERPASVVKELLENALDAGAAHITVRVEGGGQRLVEVADDGCGIPPEEVALAVERHATSKLASATDLFNISSLGFRGEALASIASVSRFTLTSMVAGQPHGSRIRVEGGRAGKPEPAGAPPGTTVRVEDLFFNLPARRKFLKSETSERRLIESLAARYALAYPHVRFTLEMEGRTSLQTSGSGGRVEVLANLFGAAIARQLVEVAFRGDALDVSGYISPPGLTRSNRREIIFFVNGRPVQDISMMTALLQAYHGLLMVGRFPYAILLLQIPPESVDVNVHPTKAEVRFRNPDGVFSSVQRAVRRALLAHSPVTELPSQTMWTDRTWESPQTGHTPTPLIGREGGSLTLPSPASSQPPPPTPAGPGQGRITPPGVPLLRLVGQIASTYLVAEGPDGLYLVDQHAAHERVLYEKLSAQPAGSLPAQNLLEPVSVELPSHQASLVEGQLPLLGALGFHVEPFGRGAYLVRALPALLAHMQPEAALRVLVEDFEEDETPLGAALENRLKARICKRAAVKAGQALSPDEQRNLLADLEACQSPRTCPHGRPTMIYISVDLLERQFGRRGAR